MGDILMTVKPIENLIELTVVILLALEEGHLLVPAALLAEAGPESILREAEVLTALEHILLEVKEATALSLVLTEVVLDHQVAAKVRDLLVLHALALRLASQSLVAHLEVVAQKEETKSWEQERYSSRLWSCQ